MKFFFDNNVSPKLAKAKHALEEPDHEVVHLRERYPDADSESVTDVAWIDKLGEESAWIIVSGDLTIRTRPAERDALRNARLTTFFLADGYTRMNRWEQVRWLIEKWPEIKDLAGRFGPGSTFRVPKRGKIQTV